MIPRLAQEIKTAYDADFKRISTHYEGCWKYHWSCAMARLLDIIEAIDEENPQAFKTGVSASSGMSESEQQAYDAYGISLAPQGPQSLPG